MHISDEQFALLILQGPSDHESAHLGQCADCQHQYELLGRARDVLRDGGPMAQPPPERVWQAIAAKTDEPAVDIDEPAGSGSVTQLQPRRKFSGVWLAAAAAVGAVATLVGSSFLSPQPDELMLASAELEVLSGDARPAAAQIVEVDGEQVLRIENADLPQDDDSYLEVWLIDPKSSGLITVGLLEGESGDFVLPANLSTSTFSVVDVSIEAYDGDPTHSGDSVWRGALSS